MSEPVEDANTIKTEMGIGRRHIPEFAWPTVVLALVLLGCFIAASFMAGTGLVPLWAGMVASNRLVSTVESHGLCQTLSAFSR